MAALTSTWLRRWSSVVTSTVPRKLLVVLSALLVVLIVLLLFTAVPTLDRQTLQRKALGTLQESYATHGRTSQEESVKSHGQNSSREGKNGTQTTSNQDQDGDINANMGQIVESTNIEASGRNITPSNARVLLYNRVPKCGSTTVKAMMHRLSWKNGFRHMSARVYDQRKFDHEAQREFIKIVSSRARQTPYSYDRHMYFFNVTQHGFPAFAWMNFVRNPVSRFISDFYYVRGRHRWIHNRVLKNQPRPSELWFNMSLDTCVAEANTECLPALGQDHELQLTYFCGQHPHCRIVGDRGALARAKRHAEHYYSVVGILEEMPLSLQVLQAYMPRFFTGATQMNNSTGEIRRNVKHDKPEVSETTKRALESRLKEDMEFYQFLKQRLHLQAEALSEK